MIDSFRKTLKAARAKYSKILKRFHLLEAIPVALRTVKLCLKYINENSRELTFIPWERLNLTDAEAADLCMEAVSGNAPKIMLAFVPPELKPLELYIAAVERPVFDDPYRYVPVQLREWVRETAMKNAEKSPNLSVLNTA